MYFHSVAKICFVIFHVLVDVRQGPAIIMPSKRSPSNFSLLREFHKFKRFDYYLSLLSSKAYLERDIGICRTFMMKISIMLLLNVVRVQC